MSVQALSWVFEHSRSTGGARLVLLAMANEANSSGELTAYHRSQSHLAKRANTTVRSVRRAIDILVDLGELEVLREGVGYDSSDYRLLLEESGQGVRSERTDVPLREDKVSAPSSRSSRSSRDDDSGLETFEQFWALCPRKEGKGAAQRVWKGMDAEQKFKATAAMPLHAAAWKRKFADDKTFIPHPSTWLNQMRWEDEIDQSRPKRQTGEFPVRELADGQRLAGNVWS